MHDDDDDGHGGGGVKRAVSVQTSLIMEFVMKVRSYDFLTRKQ
jgi:hypothetical protein